MYSALNNLELFDANMRMTQEYCALQMQVVKHPAVALRSLDTDRTGSRLWKYNRIQKDEHVEWLAEPIADNRITELFEEQLRQKRTVISTIGNNAYKGKILVCEYENSPADGASEAEAAGFIDDYDLPPIDTWFFLSVNGKQKLLYSWIPDAYCSLVNEAIEVNVFEMLWWIDTKHDSWYKKLFL